MPRPLSPACRGSKFYLPYDNYYHYSYRHYRFHRLTTALFPLGLPRAPQVAVLAALPVFSRMHRRVVERLAPIFFKQVGLSVDAAWGTQPDVSAFA